MENPEKLATQGTKNKPKAQHNICWTPPHAEKKTQTIMLLGKVE